jgi:hypothetical protein
MKKKKTFTTTATNSIESAAPASVWNYKGCAGKGGKPLNAKIVEQEHTQEKESE